MRRALRVLIGAVLCTGATAAQTPTAPQPPPTFRSGVTLLTIDVTVLGDRGRPHPGLTPTDFDVEIDGRRQPVRTLDYVSFESTPPTATGQVRATEPAGIAPSAARLSAPVDRTFLLFVDDLAFAPLEHKALVSAAERFLATLRPVDRVGVATSSGRQFVAPTHERAPVVAALRVVTGSFHSPQSEAVVRTDDGIIEGEQIALSEAVRISRNDLGLRDEVARRELGAGCAEHQRCLHDIELLASEISRSLESGVVRQARSWVTVAEEFGRVQGAKILVAVSGGLPSELAGSAFRRFGAAATKAGIAVHVIGQERSGVSAEDRMFAGSTGTGQDRRRRDNPFFLDGLRDAAAIAGGVFYPAIGQSDDDFARVLSASAARYRLGIELPAGAAPGAVLKTRVRVKQSGLRVLAATEYTTPGPPPVLTTEEQLRSVIGQGNAFYGVAVSVTPLVRRHPNGAALELGMHVDVPTTASPPLDVMFAVIGDTGRVAQSGRTKIERTGGGESQAFALSVPVPPGSYRVRLGVADSAGNVGSSEQLVTVRLSKMGGLLASHLFARAVGPGERVAVLSADVVPESATHLDVGMELYRDESSTPDVPREAQIQLTTEAGVTVATHTVSLPPSETSWYAGVRVPLRTLPPGRYAMSIALLESGAETARVSRGVTTTAAAADLTTTNGPASEPTPGAVLEATAVRTVPGLPSPDSIMAILRRDAGANRPAPDVAHLLEKRAFVTQLSTVPGSAPASNVPAATLPDLDFWRAVDQFATGATGARADFARGVSALHRKDWGAAVANLERALDAEPDALVALQYLGAASAGIGEDRDAAGAWALSLGAPDVTAEWQLAYADALVRAQDRGGAIIALTNAKARWPDDTRILARRGELLLASGSVDEARADLESGLATAPDHERLLFLLTAVTFADVARGDRPDALKTFEGLSARYLVVVGDKPSPVAEWRRAVTMAKSPK